MNDIENIIRRIVREEIEAALDARLPSSAVERTNDPAAQWLTTSEVAALSRAHVGTVRLALERGELHGYQLARRGRWSIRPDCAEAWIEAAPCAHKNRTTSRKQPISIKSKQGQKDRNYAEVGSLPRH